jgi:hypothetical protein
MDSDEAQSVLQRHWPEFNGVAKREQGCFLVQLAPRHRTRPRAELSARSFESYEAAVLDLATWTPPTLRCMRRSCPLCRG